MPGRVTDTRPKRYAILLADRLVIYETESSRLAEAAFELFSSTTVTLETGQMTLRTPEAHGQPNVQELVLLEAEDADARNSLHGWRTAISDTIAQRPAYCARAADARIWDLPQEGSRRFFSGLAVAIAPSTDSRHMQSSQACAVEGCGGNAAEQCHRCVRYICIYCSGHSVLSFGHVVFASPSSFATPRHFNACIECIEDAVGRVEESVTGEVQMKALEILNAKLSTFEERLFDDGEKRALSSLHNEFERRERSAIQRHDRTIEHERVLLRQARNRADRIEQSPIVAAARYDEMRARYNELRAEIERTTGENLLLDLQIELSTVTADIEEQERVMIAAATRQSTELPQAEVDFVDEAGVGDVTNEDDRDSLSAVSEPQHHNQRGPHEALPLGISFPTKRGEARQVQR